MFIALLVVLGVDLIIVVALVAFVRAIEVGSSRAQLAPARKSHPEDMTREQATTGWMGAAMDDYKQHLGRLAVHDDALVGDEKSTDEDRQ